jgi:hypothetical protein
MRNLIYYLQNKQGMKYNLCPKMDHCLFMFMNLLMYTNIRKRKEQK